ncbi:hypothetical protein MJ904_06800 [Massilia sp. MB5]|uniref:hypothetical protein n=1 Tax=Massilia sp. MB5 TaxID=2919578 RepID=UPI001F10BEE3|nr:hypothetical protein [Massilia sp. MB5]UMR31894.1 hypothetical protein MJ904_06800 [Massilia sp. MB5]
MSICTRCGASFSCAMVDAGPDGKLPTQPCWCTYFPPAVPVPVPVTVPELPAAPAGMPPAPPGRPWAAGVRPV